MDDDEDDDAGEGAARVFDVLGDVAAAADAVRGLFTIAAAAAPPDRLASVTYFCAAASDLHRPCLLSGTQSVPLAAAADAPPLRPECSVYSLAVVPNPIRSIILRKSRKAVSYPTLTALPV